MSKKRKVRRVRVQQKQWKWFGYAGHFIMGHDCRFRLCTRVGGFLISTVGDLRDERTGDAREIGCGRKFETFVFKAGPVCNDPKCDCGLPTQGGGEIDSLPANTAGNAQRNHYEMCEKYSRRAGVVP